MANASSNGTSDGWRLRVPIWVAGVLAAGCVLPAVDAWGDHTNLRLMATVGGLAVFALCLGMARDRERPRMFRAVLCGGVIVLWWVIYTNLYAIPGPVRASTFGPFPARAGSGHD